eukprot:CAMPEP_0194303766 /NCGR_PEP_ID=MMETSP0171-20130528/1584_1 /TAXON_ID=218684 /ORGANISM="Corethron pennatum, Strain L29A3" /LENGTH=275 /DNA_ID=CAMNT_0039054793 /DNA_START=37 /DNA_END=864 /DNA_ORIENTATION=+
MMNTRTLSVVSSILTLSFSSANEVATSISVMEIGDGPSVVRRTSGMQKSSVDGVKSFWSKLHLYDDKFVKQHPGMSMVPDLFNQPKCGVVVNLKNIDFAGDASVDSFYVDALPAELIPNSVGDEHTNLDSFRSGLLENINGESKLSVITLDAAKITSEEVDSVLKSIRSDVTGKVVLHVVSEGPEARRRLDENNNNGDDDGDDDKYAETGYYTSAGYYVTNFKSMEKIQYTNVVLWTTIGLVVVVTYATYLMMNMPLMADTLLFGESAKMAAAET